MSDLVERLKANPTYDDRSDAADLIETQATRIAELEAALEDARREGMEEAARIAENEPEPEGEPPIELHGRSVKNIAISSVRATKHSIAAAIRAEREEAMIDWGKPIETTEGYPAKVISRDYRRDNKVLYVVQVESPVSHLYSGDSYLKMVSPTTGVGMGINLRNRKTKREGWINIYSTIEKAGCIYNTEQEAKESASRAVSATVKIEWEE